MSFCENCGTELDQGGHCPKCGASSATHGVRLAEGECVVKEYWATTGRTWWSKVDGYLVVTNRRLLFVGEGNTKVGRSILIREVHLPDVSGVSSYYGKGLCITCLIIAAILGFVIIPQLASFLFVVARIHSGYILLLLLPLIILSVWLVWKAIRKTISLIIHSRSGDESPVALVAAQSKRFPFAGAHAAQAVVAGPGPDAELLVSEIGALILDLQTRGNLAVEAWRRGR